VTVSPSSPRIRVGEVVTLRAVVERTGVCAPVLWTSGDARVVSLSTTIGETTVVTGVGTGTASVVAALSGSQGSAGVTVTE
jgi:uncharacterized protein YjdB